MSAEKYLVLLDIESESVRCTSCRQSHVAFAKNMPPATPHRPRSAPRHGLELATRLGSAGAQTAPSAKWHILVRIDRFLALPPCSCRIVTLENWLSYARNCLQKKDGAGDSPAPPLSLLPNVAWAVLPIYHALSEPTRLLFYLCLRSIRGRTFDAIIEVRQRSS